MPGVFNHAKATSPDLMQKPFAAKQPFDIADLTPHDAARGGNLG